MTPEQKRDTALESVLSAKALDHWQWSENRRSKFSDRGCRCELCESVPLIKAALTRAVGALEATPDTPDENDREVAHKISRLGAEHTPILAWGGGAVPEPMGKVCSKCGDEPCTFKAELDALLPALSRAVPDTTEPEWEYSCRSSVHRKPIPLVDGVDYDENPTEGHGFECPSPSIWRRPRQIWELLPERGEG